MTADMVHCDGPGARTYLSLLFSFIVILAPIYEAQAEAEIWNRRSGQAAIEGGQKNRRIGSPDDPWDR